MKRMAEVFENPTLHAVRLRAADMRLAPQAEARPILHQATLSSPWRLRPISSGDLPARSESSRLSQIEGGHNEEHIFAGSSHPGESWGAGDDPVPSGRACRGKRSCA